MLQVNAEFFEDWIEILKSPSTYYTWVKSICKNDFGNANLQYNIYNCNWKLTLTVHNKVGLEFLDTIFNIAVPSYPYLDNLRHQTYLKMKKIIYEVFLSIHCWNFPCLRLSKIIQINNPIQYIHLFIAFTISECTTNLHVDPPLLNSKYFLN